MKKSLMGSRLLFPDNTSGIIRYNCSYNSHILSYYLHKMYIAKKLKNRDIYEYYLKQNNLEFRFNFIPFSSSLDVESISIKGETAMPSNIIFFSQPLFPIGLKLKLISCVSSSSTSIPDTYTELKAWEKLDYQSGDSIIVVSECVRTTYQVI